MFSFFVMESKGRGNFPITLSSHSLLSSVFLPVFKPEELRQALMPTLESLYRQDPESLPFRMPVDPQLLCIPVCIPADVELYKFLSLVSTALSLLVFTMSLSVFFLLA